LGDNPDTLYKEVTMELEPGDAILFYTDGVMDLHNAEGASWGEREFIKTVVKAVGEGPTTKEKMEILKTEINGYRQDSALIDDVTLFMCEYRKSA
jgi:sigma-B regulation protein RsbU (phosphoserine phosphatase)